MNKNRIPPPQTGILVVDDTPANLGLLFDHLKAAGFKVLIDTKAESALETIHQVQPDIILLDVGMPGMNGFEICRRLKEHEMTQNIPVCNLISENLYNTWIT